MGGRAVAGSAQRGLAQLAARIGADGVAEAARRQAALGPGVPA
jgi:hypothetical protein